LVKSHKSREVLEVGSAYGYSAVAMALAGGHVTAVDPHSWLPSLEPMMANLADYGVADKVHVVVETSFHALSVMVAAGRKFDVVFIDGDHSAKAVREDVRLALQVLAPGGTLACHDYTEACCCPEVGPTLDGLFPEGPTLVVDTLFVVEP